MGHNSWLTLLLEKLKGNLSQNASVFGETFIGHKKPTWQDFEPITAAMLVAVFLIFLGMRVKSQMRDTEAAVIPDESLTLRTFMEAFLGYFYDLAKSIMDAERAKKYFPLIGASALFVFFCNLLALIPGMPVPTSNLSITLGCALVVFVAFNAYGIMVNGLPYVLHLCGPTWRIAGMDVPLMAPLLLPIELISLSVRPVTLAVRLMINMAVDHLLLGIFMGLFALVLPVPIMVLGVIVVCVQTLVFTLLTTIYIGLATEDMAHH